MTTETDFLNRSEAALKTVIQEYRPTLLEAAGTVKDELKADNTPVTELDLAVETAIRQALLGVDPSVGLEGEEHGTEGSRERYWLIDPIDGTEALIRGMPSYRCMATFVEGGELQYAFVYNVATDQLYTARKDQGAFCNDQAIKLSQRPPHRAWLEYTADVALPEVTSLIPVIRKATRGIRITGDFTHTLQGRFEGHLYFKSLGSTWDWAPWALLIKEAGGKVANFGSDGYDYLNPDFLAATPTVFDHLKPILDKALEEAEN